MSDTQGVPPPLPPVPAPDARVPPPWETDGPIVQRFIDTIRAVLVEPVPFFKRMRRDGGLGAPLVYALIGVLIGSVGSYLTQTMMPFGGYSYGMGGRGLFFGLLFAPAFALVSLVIASGIFHVLLLLIASTRQSFETTFRVVAYTFGSTSPLNIIPFLGGLIGGVWALIVLVLGLSEAHEVSQAQSAVVVVLPAVVCCGVGILFGGALLALIFGAAAAGMHQ